MGEPDYIVLETPSTKARRLVKLGEKMAHTNERQVPLRMLIKELSQVKSWAERIVERTSGVVVSSKFKRGKQYLLSCEQGLVTTLNTLEPIANHDIWRFKGAGLVPEEPPTVFILRTIIFYQEIID